VGAITSFIAHQAHYADQHAGFRGGKTALQWPLLKQASHVLGVPITCVVCHAVHELAPFYGRCPCGSFLFGVSAQRVLPLEHAVLDFHGGER
jgi:hypothetical protein